MSQRTVRQAETAVSLLLAILLPAGVPVAGQAAGTETQVSVQPQAGTAQPRAASSGQSQRASPIDIPPAPARNPQNPAQGPASPCPVPSDRYIPADHTLEARVPILLDSAHLKPGKTIWVNTVYETTDQECHLNQSAVLYGRVTEASAERRGGSELALEFDNAECNGRAHVPLKLRLIAISAPPDDNRTVHDALPVGPGYLDSGWGTGQRLNPGEPPKFIRPGTVAGFKNLSLDPVGGPGCSAKLSSAGRSVQLGAGTLLLLLDDPDSP